jgi:hypothetical protein
MIVLSSPHDHSHCSSLCHIKNASAQLRLVNRLGIHLARAKKRNEPREPTSQYFRKCLIPAESLVLQSQPLLPRMKRRAVSMSMVSILLFFHARQPGAHVWFMIIMEMVKEFTSREALIVHPHKVVRSIDLDFLDQDFIG